ncbi:hypothetical protein C8255_10290 [filamentous cyanobacterium CCP3]|nr:hypothetical protein C8255_10290 [filamentous cyanobacterium CCP3]
MSLASRRLPGYRPVPWFKIAAKVTIPGALTGAVLGTVLAVQSIHEKVEQTISKTLGRSVLLGEVRGVSHRGLWLGQTVVPAVGFSESSGSIEAVVIGLDWGAMLRQRHLQATVTLVRPQVFLELPVADTLWPLPSRLPQTQALAALSRLQVEAGTLTLRAAAEQGGDRPTLVVSDLQSTVYHPGSAPMTFAAVGQLGQGRFQAEGTVEPERRSLQATATMRNLPLPSLNLVLPASTTLRAGHLDGTLSLSAQGEEVLKVAGTIAVQSGQMQLGQAPASLDHLQSQITFDNNPLI